jgi:hypothetical protein
MNHIMSVMVDIYSQIGLSKPFDVQSVTIDKNLGSEPTSKNSDIFQSEFMLERISFPHCFLQTDGTAGQNVTIDLDRLLLNSGIPGLVSPTTVFHGQTDKNGNATIQFPIPVNASAGLHLIMIGIDKTVLTADCEVNVTRPELNEGVIMSKNPFYESHAGKITNQRVLDVANPIQIEQSFSETEP